MVCNPLKFQAVTVWPIHDLNCEMSKRLENWDVWSLHISFQHIFSWNLIFGGMIGFWVEFKWFILCNDEAFCIFIILENLKVGVESFNPDYDTSRSKSRSRSPLRSRSPVPSSPSESRDGSPKSPPRGGGLPPFPFGVSREELIQPLSRASSTSAGFHQVHNFYLYNNYLLFYNLYLFYF